MIGAIVGSAATMGVLDSLWLSLRYVYHKDLFQSVQGTPLRIRWVSAVLVYAVLLAAVYLWAIKDARSMNDAILRGALVGLIMYGFYDLTNYATLSRWTLGMTVTDALWGGILCAAAAAVGFMFLRK
jgi:uncharacterized membrane protein